MRKDVALRIVGGLAVAVFVSLPLAAQMPWDQTFEPDIQAPDRLRANHTTYSAIMEVLKPTRPTPTLEEIDRLKTLQIENIWSVLGDYGHNYVTGLLSTRPGERIVGRALTVRSLPDRPDVRRAVGTLAEEGDWSTFPYVRAAEEASPGDVLVATLGGDEGTTFFGDISGLGMKLRGVRGVIIDGGTRDLTELSTDLYAGFPVFARFFDPEAPRWLSVEWNSPIRVGTVTVLPGDIVVAEDEAAVFFPPEILDEVVESALARQTREDFQREIVKQKKYRMRDVYPYMAPELQEQYDAQTKRPAQP